MSKLKQCKCGGYLFDHVPAMRKLINGEFAERPFACYHEIFCPCKRFEPIHKEKRKSEKKIK